MLVAIVECEDGEPSDDVEEWTMREFGELAVCQGEKAGFRHRLAGRICLGIGAAAKLRNIITVVG